MSKPSPKPVQCFQRLLIHVHVDDGCPGNADACGEVVRDGAHGREGSSARPLNRARVDDDRREYARASAQVARAGVRVRAVR